MAVAVPGVVMLLAVAAVLARNERAGLREAIVTAGTFCGGFVVAMTEGLGAVGQLRYVPVLAAWALAASGLVAFVWLRRGRRNLAQMRPTPLDWIDITLLALLVAIVAASGTLAVFCPPNNWYVCLYHLPRQVQWLQQASVEHFPTQDYRLTVNPPFAEFVGLQLMLLSGTDRLATVESWGTMLLALAAVSLLARELGLSRKGQLLAALFAATIPVGFHEAANGKNDWLVAFWLAAATWWIVRAWKMGEVRPVEAAMAGLTLGLLVLTKGTGGVYALPVAALGGLALVARRPRGWLAAAAIVAALAVAPNVPHWARNLSAYGSISGRTFGLANDRHDPAACASGIVRNVGMHLASPKEAWNRKVNKYVIRVHRWIGETADDPRTTWLGTPFQVEYRLHSEDFATAPAHVILLLAALPLLAFLGTRRDRRWLVYVLATTGGFLMFCVLFKWQPWHPRLHLPAFALGGVAIGWLGTRRVVWRSSPLLVAALLISLLPAATRCDMRSLGPNGLSIFRHDEDSLRFCGQDAIARDAREVVTILKAARPPAIDFINQSPVPWDYHLTRWLHDGSEAPRIGYFYPVAGSPLAQPPADFVIDVGSAQPPKLIRHPQTRRVYRTSNRIGSFTIYRPLETGAKWNGYRLGASGDWEPIAGTAQGPAPVCDHPVARFGIGVEQPGHSEQSGR
jgi:hypothetical protein